MGYMRAHSIAVESWNKETLLKAHEKAVKIFGDLVTNIVQERCNGYEAFFIAPDGSKEGWGDSDTGDLQRATFIKELKDFEYEDGSNQISFCEFYWDDDNGEAGILAHN